MEGLRIMRVFYVNQVDAVACCPRHSLSEMVSEIMSVGIELARGDRLIRYHRYQINTH